ncbi:ankyrin repeat domain-containing protein 35 [Pyrgilauda ruficollis]|uniref:ankyrin repeat domain-containing protein 35 n=1 Tax=Pyrgilauda ruficollis TaxID=221976 RepID=UPI001B880447|nr:ankyrin repeat domain-containing protein 35 [Pyrgilauda ruficollis]
MKRVGGGGRAEDAAPERRLPGVPQPGGGRERRGGGPGAPAAGVPGVPAMKRMFSCSSSQVTDREDLGKLRHDMRGGTRTGGDPVPGWGLGSCPGFGVPQVESWTRQDQKLLEAVTRGDVARVAALAARKAARPAKLNARGQSALHLAAAGGLTECLTLLLEHGAPVNGTNDDGSTALHLATIACQPQCVKVLLQHGANERHVDGQNRTPLHWAASSGCASSVLLLCDHEAPLDVPDALLRRGAEPGLADRDGRTALELALAHGSLEVAELLQGHKRDKDTGNVTGSVTGQAPSWALQKIPDCGRRENGAGQVGIQGEEEEEEEEEQRDGRAARRLREELARKTLECRRLEEAAEGIRRRLRELVRLLPARDAGEDEEDEEDDGACLELLTRRVAELRKRTRDEEWQGGQGSGEAPALIPFLAWLGEECSKMREAKAGAFSRSRELRGEAENSPRDQAWEQLAAGLEQALEQQDQIHARMLQGSQTLLEKLRREPVNATEPAAGGKNREEIPAESGRMEKELLELREGNGKLLVELARLGRERERLQRELRELRDPGNRDEARRLRRELRALRDGLGARVREAGGDAGAAIVRDLHRRLDALVRSQHEALQLITEMEGEPGESPGSDGEGGTPGEPGGGAEQGPERGTAGVPPGSEAERWREAAAAAEERAAGRERELRELRETAEGLESSLAALRERAARLERACRDKDGKLKQLLVETEKLSAEVLGLRGRSARLQLQLEVQQKQHRDTVAVYRSHLLHAAQGFMDQGVHAALLRILRAEAGAGLWH